MKAALIIQLSLVFMCFLKLTFAAEVNEITPYKFDPENIPFYDIPASSRFTINRFDGNENVSDIVYYLSTPAVSSYPIVLICSGSIEKDNIYSIIHIHRFLLQEFMNLNIGILTIEGWGVDGNTIHKEEVINHYTLSRRLKDHSAVVEHLKSNPPIGWDGKFILLGISEGGPLVTRLTEDYSENIDATIIWSGVGDWNWRELVWTLIEDWRKNASWWEKIRDFMPRWMPFAFDFPKNRNEYDAHMDEIFENPAIEKEFVGQTYKYHADSLRYPKPDYGKIRTPFLVVAGAYDPVIWLIEIFVEKAKKAGVDITYMRIEDMGHYIRKRPDIIQKSFDWLEKHVQKEELN